MLDNFLFGAATSAYQIEGAWNEDGKQPSIWDEISHNKTAFKVQNGHTGDIACNHYHEWKEDVGLMKEMGLQAYRFSISWSRICSKDGCFNLKGIKFYSDLVDELLKNNIEPFVTLYHWDLPKWLDDTGGWSNKKTVDAFVQYAESLFSKLDKVRYWITFNEPAVFVNNFWGHDNFPEAVRNVLIAHGKTVQHYKGKRGKHDGKIGISLNLIPIFPNVYDGRDDIAVENLDKRHNGIWLEPIFHGHFPKGINRLCGFRKNLLKFSDAEKNIVNAPIDFLGINYYTAVTVKYNKYKPPAFVQTVPSDFKRDDINTEIRPYGLEYLLQELKKKYGDIETYITENGCAYNDTFTHDGKIHDERRIKYIKQHLFYCNSAIKKGINLKGYFYWSLMDNFEWLFGYTKRFGLLYIFYPTQSRVPKDSYPWYKKIITDPEFRKEELSEAL